MWLILFINLFAECNVNIQVNEKVEADKYGITYDLYGEFDLEVYKANKIRIISQPGTLVRIMYLTIKGKDYNCYSFNLFDDDDEFYTDVIHRCVCRTERVKKFLKETQEDLSENYDAIMSSPSWWH